VVLHGWMPFIGDACTERGVGCLRGRLKGQKSEIVLSTIPSSFKDDELEYRFFKNF
jgi:hypothetical protein